LLKKSSTTPIHFINPLSKFWFIGDYSNPIVPIQNPGSTFHFSADLQGICPVQGRSDLQVHIDHNPALEPETGDQTLMLPLSRIHDERRRRRPFPLVVLSIGRAAANGASEGKSQPIA
jgi:hypothetical protein